jgi:hypothetical protein
MYHDALPREPDKRTAPSAATQWPPRAGADGQFAKLLIELFDAVMTTFRWTEVQLAQE